METLTLVQTGKRNPLPLVLFDGPEGSYWSKWLKFCEEELLVQGFISETDFNIFDLVDSVDEAIEKIDRFYFRYHSLRYVQGQLVIRLNSALDRQKVKELNKSFSDILTPKGGIRLSGPLPIEEDEPEIAHLSRLILDFNKRDFGRLKTLIDEINHT
jgi:hypothetical protein